MSSWTVSSGLASGFFAATFILNSCLIFVIDSAYSADNQPIERKMDDEIIMGRVKLVGVIADSSSSKAGIAVIKDAQTGKSYAIKVGDSLPGVGHIILSEVQRDVLTFSSPEKKYLIRPTINIETEASKTEVASQTESEETTTAETDGPGLFEKWAAGVAERGSELISLEALKTLDKKYKNLGKDEQRRKAMNSVNEAVSSDDAEVGNDEAVVIEEDMVEYE